MYVCNYLTNGNLDWEVDLPSNGQAGLRYLELDGAGNMYVAGFEDVGTSGDPDPLRPLGPTGQRGLAPHLRCARSHGPGTERTYGHGRRALP